MINNTYGHAKIAELSFHKNISMRAATLAFTVKQCQIILARKFYQPQLKEKFIDSIAKITKLINVIFKVRNSYYEVNNKDFIKDLKKFLKKKK